MKISGWGRYPKIDTKKFYPFSHTDLAQTINNFNDIIPYAMGRSYGDSALGDNVIFTQNLNMMMDFDETTGILTCEAGVTLSEIIDSFLPRGWFLLTTPGTKHISVGGAIASDVHGKNHHSAGCFSSCVIFFDIITGDGQILRCSKTENPDLFHATCGGMGLTGIIIRASIQLKKVDSCFIEQRTIKSENLLETLELFDEYSDVTYSVAWIDCLSKGDSQGRSLLMVGEHAEDHQLHPKKSLKLSVPFDFPGFSLNKYTVSAFNMLYYNKALKKVSDSITSIDSFFYPLDAINNWNRIYGKNGFLQYQFVIPKEAGFEGLTKILTEISNSGLGSFLTVLKLFGKENDNYLSFPMEGYTLALDFKVEKKLFPLLEKLDKLVLDYGGRLYLTKDSRMDKNIFETGYPGLESFIDVRNKYNLKSKFNSLQSKRLGI